uniref:Eukaryotic translation initiation factor 4E n=1 Tax=Caligus rogercresseyi TaxID=217165 RepID=C1BQK7_CALRO|nr:Eukaryotic translation initiation factor 4E [Caligus rogercresseyi]
MTPKLHSQKQSHGSKGKKKSSKANNASKRPEEPPATKTPLAPLVKRAPLEIKHPLQDSWTLWFFKFNKSNDWSDNLVIVYTFTTIEDFWALYRYLRSVSNLSPGSDYSLFKTGTTPMWEDANNREGGRWIIKSERQRRTINLDKMWLELLLFLIGGDEEIADEINGGYVNVRQKFDKVSLWMKNRDKKSLTTQAGAAFKERMGMDRKESIEFEFHEDSCNRSSSSAVFRYVV